MTRTLIGLVLLAAALLGAGDRAAALPGAKDALCKSFPKHASCAATGAASCAACHTTPPALGPFGACVKGKAKAPVAGSDPAARLAAALVAAVDADCDGDGKPERAALEAGRTPGAITASGDPTEALGGYDTTFAYRRVLADFCGRSPTFEERKAFAALAADERSAEVDRAWRRCVTSEHWIGKDGVLWQMAHEKIRPIQVLKSGEDAGAVALGDYYDDYNFYVYHHTGDRDVRKILTGQYYVTRSTEPTVYTEVAEMPLHPQATFLVEQIGIAANGRQQFVYPERRAGLLTTLWFMSSNIMFTAIPRTAAANAMRAWLGIDIAKGEGLEHAPPAAKVPIIDYDARGIAQPACISCHQLLDPMSYPFSTYNGLNLDNLIERLPSIIPQLLKAPDPDTALADYVRSKPGVLVPGHYQPERIQHMAAKEGAAAPLLGRTPEAGWLFGKPVKDVVEWARVAVESEAFAQTIVRDYWRQLVGPQVEPQHAALFAELWRGLMTTYEYNVESMIHALVRSDAYGRP